MYPLAAAATKDFNANIAAIKDAASREMLDTVVSVSEVGYNTSLSVTVSNPHVLKEKTSWQSSGGTPLWTATLNLINMLTALPDANKDDVSFLVLMTTDGAATDHHMHQTLKVVISPLLATGRWTFVARVPKGISHSHRNDLISLGIPDSNIQEWETSSAGMAASTAQTTQAMSGYFRARTAGAKASSAFYADASQVNVAALVDITKKISLYVVPAADEGMQIRDFILRHRMQYLKGAAFYQLTKTESRVSHTKLILIRDRQTGKFFGGQEARTMIGLPNDRNARLHPGDHKNFDLFIQSESINRKLVGGTGVAYWEEKGVPFTQDEIDLFTGVTKAAPKPAVVQLPAVAPTNKPTKSPIPVTPRVVFFNTREEARNYCRSYSKDQQLIQNDKTAPKGKRWFI